MLPTHLLFSGKVQAKDWPKKAAPVTRGNRMPRHELETIVKIQLSQVKTMMMSTGGCDSFNRTLCANKGKTIPVLYTAQQQGGKGGYQGKGNALDSALGKPTKLNIKNPKPLLQMITAEELAAARAQAEEEDPTGEKKKAHGSWRMAMLRTIEDCHSCIVEYEDLRYMDQSDASASDKAEMRSLMTTLTDRVFGTFTTTVDGKQILNDDVLLTVAGIAKGRRLLGRILPLLEGERRDEFMTALLRNLAKIVADVSKAGAPTESDTGSAEQLLLDSLGKACATYDLNAVRVQLLAAYQMSQDLDARNLFGFGAGCVVLTALAQRGTELIGLGKSDERSRSQWQAALKDVLMFCTMHCVAICGVTNLDNAGSKLVKSVVVAYKPYMSDDQGGELSMCFSSQGLDPQALGF